MSAPRTLAAVTVVTAGTKVPLLATSPIERYRVVRVEIDQSAGANKIFVGDLNVSASQYVACLTLSGQIAWEIIGEAIDPSRIYLDASANATKAQISVVQ